MVLNYVWHRNKSQYKLTEALISRGVEYGYSCCSVDEQKQKYFNYFILDMQNSTSNKPSTMIVTTHIVNLFCYSDKNL